MLTISRHGQKTLFAWILVGIVLSLWIGSKWFEDDWFENPWKYPAKAASLSATSLMCLTVILSTRARILERWFGGLDKMYQAHKHLGRWAFYIICFHPLFLAMDRASEPAEFLRFFLPREGFSAPALGHTSGVILFALMFLLIALTLWFPPRYHIWKRSHEWFGAVLIIICAHIWWLDADIPAYPLLTAVMGLLLCAALLSFVYIRFLYRFIGPKYRYAVDKVEKIGAILELTFSPLDTKMNFWPSQFVYLVVHKKGISPEPHPYSIACGYNLEARFKLGIKQEGDHTRTLDLLESGDRATVYGPYGCFSRAFLQSRRDCLFIGGGIGITPFLGMWHVALHSEERLPESDVPMELKQMHPEIIRTWKSPRVHLIYVCRNPEDASFDDDIRMEVLTSIHRGFSALEKRGHVYDLYLSGEKGRITGEIIRQMLRRDLLNRDIFLCGPTLMIDDLHAQFREMGVPEKQIHIEDFNLV